MDQKQAVSAFAALAQEGRLRVVRLLVKAGPSGLAAGSISEALASSSSNMSFHFRQLEQAGLIMSRREGRSIIYSANFGALANLNRFLLEECCGARPELCGLVFVEGAETHHRGREAEARSGGCAATDKGLRKTAKG